MNQTQLHELLEYYYSKYNAVSFIEEDPISIPHQYTKLQDIEISGFFAATLAWGLRKTIINKSCELMDLMDNSPYDFIVNHKETDMIKLQRFKHRTFNSTDLLYFIHFFKKYYTNHNSLETLFIPEPHNATNVKTGIDNFYNHFVSNEYFPLRKKNMLLALPKNQRVNA